MQTRVYKNTLLAQEPRRNTTTARRVPTARPLARTVALLVAAGGFWGNAQANQAFSRAWMAQKNMMQDTAAATGRLPNGTPAASLTSPNVQQQRANEQLQRSIQNLGQAAQSIAAMQAAQAAARQAAALESSVPDGLAEGGLKVDTNSLTAGWLNAKNPTQKAADGRTQVTIEQTADKAILNWETFNVGRNTTVEFQQKQDWAVLNRVNDPQARPSKIQGQIKADGTVMIVNRNGIVFTGTSQVDTRNLVAAAAGMTNAQFDKGLFSEARGTGYVPTFANDLAVSATAVTHGATTGDVVVEAGARIATRKPESVTQGGGYVLLVGRETHNRGTIVTPGGQTALAAGDSFVIRRGLGTDGNPNSSTRGNEIDVLRLADSAAGRVTNSGLIQATTGDITLKGHTVEQSGVLVSSTSVNTRGTIHLRAEGDDKSRVTLAPGSASAILLDDSGGTALDVQRDALLRDSGTASESGYNRRDQSLVQVISAGDVLFDGDSLTLATGGQISVNAVRRALLADRAILDVAGAVGVNVAMEANNVQINTQGNEQRDSPGNRDSGKLNNTTMWVDRRYLVRVPAGTNGYTTDRWYTGGGLLEVSGYLNTSGHGIGEWAALGGTVTFDGGQLVTQAGSSVNVSGGSLNVQTGMIRQSWLRGEDGRLYSLDNAPADVLYSGLYRGYETQHQRWGKTSVEQFNSPLIAPDRRLENGYTVGRDAGRVVVGTGSAVLEGAIESAVYQGPRQSQARDATLDGYRQSQIAAPLAGELVIGSIRPIYDTASGMLRDSPTAVVKQVEIGTAERIAQGLGLDGAMSEASAGHIALDAGWFNAQGLGRLKVYAQDGIEVHAPVTVANGGGIALHAGKVDVDADLSARGGQIVLGNMVDRLAGTSTTDWLGTPISTTPAAMAGVNVGPGVTLDTRGLWTNLRTDAGDIAGLPYINGGEIRISSTGDIVLDTGSVLDVSSGAALKANGKLDGGRGGNISLLSNQLDTTGKNAGTLRMDGELRGYGVRGGGKLTIDAGTGVVVGNSPLAENGVLKAGESAAVQMMLTQDLTMPVGTVLPTDYTYTTDRVQAGAIARGSLLATVDKPVTLAGNWQVPAGEGGGAYTVYDSFGNFYQTGMTVPAGAKLTRTVGNMVAGYVVPVGVFADGMPVAPFDTTIKAGTPFTQAVTLHAGDRLAPGTALAADVKIKPLLVLDGKVFQTGFGQYEVIGQQGVAVAPGAIIDVNMPVLRHDTVHAHAAPTGTAPADAMQQWLPPVWEEDPEDGVLTQRRGADLVLTGGSVYGKAPVTMGAGSVVSVDPGHKITMQGNGQITIDGTLNAWGGKISVLETALGLGPADTPSGHADSRSIWIGNHAVLDAAGRAATARDNAGRVYGHAADGGTIEIGAPYVAGARQVDAADAFIVVRPGARLDASGASATIDVRGQGGVALPGNGGVIALSSMRGLFVDGALRAGSAGPGAAGGTLALALETPAYIGVANNTLQGVGVEDAVRVPREMILAQVQGASLLSDDLAPGANRANGETLAFGYARVGVDRIQAGGFGNLALLANGLISFEGDVDLKMDQSLRLVASSIGLAAQADRATQVTLAAPYVQLAGSTRRAVDNSIMPNPVVGSRNLVNSGGGALGVPLVADDAGLTVDAGFLDIAGQMLMGTRGDIVMNSGTPLKVVRDAFGSVNLRSAADIRLSGAAELYSSGNLTLAASQIYPATLDSGKIVVGLETYVDQWGNMKTRMVPTRVLNIERTGEAGVGDPALPYSVFGTIQLAGPTVNQRGVVRAPMGSVTIGSSQNGQETGIVNLQPGSVTSVSAKGLTMPFGGSLDGLSYLYDGADVAFDKAGTGPAVTLAGHVIDVQAGAVLDMSGGGDLKGAAFLSGRGGSTDARMNPLIQVDPQGGFTLPGLATNPVYAIVPGAQAGYAPIVAEKGAGDPGIGRQITIGAGVPGLPAGTYTLLPSTYALLPGAFRVELNGAQATATAMRQDALAMRNGSYATSAQLSTVGTSIRDALPTQAIVTSADVLRRYSQYNETSYTDYAMAAAQRNGMPRTMIERDAKTLKLDFLSGASNGRIGEAEALHFAGRALYDTPEGGWGGSALVTGAGNYEILAAGGTPGALSATLYPVALHADDLNAIGATRLGIGGLPKVGGVGSSGPRGNVATFDQSGSNIVLREGAMLKAPEVYLVTGNPNGGITIEQGAGINTLGLGKAAWDSTNGFVFEPGQRSVVALSNGWLDMLAPAAGSSNSGGGFIDIGACAPGAACQTNAQLYSEGTIAAATDKSFELRDAVRYGTRNLSLSVGSINVGTEAALAAAAAREALTPGLRLSQDVLNRLINGDTSTGAPALENLILTARDAVNFHDSITLSTLDPVTGKSVLDRLVLTTPAIYGAGNANADARIQTDVLVWNGATTPAGQVAAGGAGTGSGKLTIEAREIEFGFAPSVRVDTVHDMDRLALGFSDVNLKASERITANRKGTLAVYQSRGAWDDAAGKFTYSGGNLHIETPLLTGHAGSVNTLRAGGDISVVAPAGATAPVLTNAARVAALGAEIALEGRNVSLDTAVALPSGKLTVSAQGDIALGDSADLDLAGRKLDFFDTSKYSWGGDVVLDSRAGNIRQAAGSHVDLSAVENRAGKFTAIALGTGAGVIDLQGSFAGGSTGHYDAGGTYVPYAAGGADIRGQQVADFAGLNQRLNAGKVSGSRNFQLKQGDLAIGDELQAREISVSVDGGRLVVNGTVDASGEQVGSIRLAARDGVTIGSQALLDAHSRVLRVDSYGKIIEAPNRAMIEIQSGNGTLVLADGARMDVRAGTDGTAQALGTVELSARRLGGARGTDVDIDASGTVRIDGARSIYVNAFQRYDNAPLIANGTVDGRDYQSITQGYLKDLHDDSVVFMGNALANGDLMNRKLAGLRGYTDAFHLRPGVEIVSATPDGDLHVDGDIDLSGFRYASVNPHSQLTGVYGAGEAGALVLRAGGNLKVYGSLTDGFDTSVLQPTVDDKGWILVKGRVPWGGDVIIPTDGLVTLAEGTFFYSGRALNYALSMQAMSLRAGTELATRATLTADLVLPAGTVLGGAVRDAGGNVIYAAGAVLSQAVTLSSGMQLDAGNRLPAAAKVGPMVWPAGVPLPFPDGAIVDVGTASAPVNGVQLAGSLTLRKGAMVPAETVVRLPGDAESVQMRPADADGNQGRNLALAPMLVPGSQSWSIRLVGGADLDAADTRALLAHSATGHVLLADTHYGLVPDTVLKPGTGLPGQYIWGPDAEIFGYVPGEPITDLASWGGEEALMGLNDWGLGVLVVKTAEGTPPEYEDRPTPGRQQLFSVLRTGTGDLDVLAAGDFTMSSPFGVYTAGTQSIGVDAAYNQSRSIGKDGNILGAKGAFLEPYVNGGTQSLYQAWYPEHGGNVLVRAQGTVRGDTIGQSSGTVRTDDVLGIMRPHIDTSAVGGWLWRQGTGSAAQPGEGVPTAWWVNFGTYVPAAMGGAGARHDGTPFLVGFTGIGTLGGGNLVLEAGADAGMMESRMGQAAHVLSRSQGLNLAVASTGRVSADGSTLTLTGGGDLDIRIGGGLNPVAEVRATPNPGSGVDGSILRYDNMQVPLNSTFTNLRGALRLAAGSVGGVELRYDLSDRMETRAYQPNVSTSAIAAGGPVLVPGDATVSIDARGDIAVGGVADPGRVPQYHNGTPFTLNGTAQDGEGWSWFSLWTPATAVNLLAAGGNLTPSMAWMDNRGGQNHSATDGRFVMPAILRAAAPNGSLFYGGSSQGKRDGDGKPVQSPYGLMLAPSPVGPQFTTTGSGALELLAGDSIYAGGYAVTQSGADGAALPTPFNPGFAGVVGQVWYGPWVVGNVSQQGLAPSVMFGTGLGSEQQYPLFSLASPSASGQAHVGQPPARFYANMGDIVGLRTGGIITRGNPNGASGPQATWYEGGGPVAIRAGRDIVNAGTELGTTETVPGAALGWFGQYYSSNPNAPLRPTRIDTSSLRGNLIVHNSADDISVISAGRDILGGTFYVAGPGLMEVTAGRDLYLADKGELKSIGQVVNVRAGDRASGAGIAVAAGVGARGLDGLGFQAFAARYLDPANQADPGRPLADQPGKAVTTYGGKLTLGDWLRAEFDYKGSEADAPAFLAAKQGELDLARDQKQASGTGATSRDLQREFGLVSQLHLVNWLTDRFGGANGLGLHFDAATGDARAFFAALPPEQQRAYLRNVYYAELKASGREYNDVGGPRAGSYLRGREAIATLLPNGASLGNATGEGAYDGDLTMFSSAKYYMDASNPTFTTRPRAGVKYLTKAQWVAGGSQANVPYFDVLDSGIHTDFGGDVSILTPGGRTLVGVDGGFVPGEGSGVLTQGSGEIQMYARDSILLGQSRIFTTFGGNILGWSAQGDINAGRGSKSTVVYTPQRRVYDDFGRVTLSPTTPNTGAGIATLNPIAEVPPGDIDLIAPLGTIDAGEAGIRVSGNVNLAALRVVNAENIQVQGKATGIPVVAAVNVGALTNASAAASQAANAAQEAVQRERSAARQAMPSVFTVRVLGTGGEPAEGAVRPREGASLQTPSYDHKGAVQVLGQMSLDSAALGQLTPTERRSLRQP
ncbi:filamentous haemagglutinin family protein [Cupriavidus pauculus]|uniref:filamentous haemagglutinin family protein n=1 Tax=Cupriavidus pauculus TaxID=82633 RepID=UPI001EE1BD64|nr:filamentous haemagglutinin family protein [Cupriavidus pauculus]GJG96816.1 filamentous hemagglutinin N-terminal domain-containing protein [Cupriavidus pauculus]